MKCQKPGVKEFTGTPSAIIGIGLHVEVFCSITLKQCEYVSIQLEPLGRSQRETDVGSVENVILEFSEAE